MNRIFQFLKNSEKARMLQKLFLCAVVLFSVPFFVFAASAPYSGKIISSQTAPAHLWYVLPTNGKRYDLGSSSEQAVHSLEKIALGISNADLKRIPIAGSSEKGDTKLRKRLMGRFLLAVHGNGMLWYVNPENLKRYYFAPTPTSYSYFRSFNTIVKDYNFDSLKIGFKYDPISGSRFQQPKNQIQSSQETTINAQLDGCRYNKPPCPSEQICDVDSNQCRIFPTSPNIENPLMSTSPPTSISQSNAPESQKFGVIFEYLTCPSSEDLQQLQHDFDFYFIDARTVTDPRYLPVFYPQTTWNDFPFTCELRSLGPSRLAIYNTFRVMRDIRFSRILPFTDNQSLYDWFSLKNYHYRVPLTQSTMKVVPFQECGFYSSAATEENSIDGNIVSATVRLHLSGVMSRLYPSTSDGSCERAESIESSILLDGFVYNPISRVSLLVHEGGHAINHKVHTGLVDGRAIHDRTIDEMGAWAVQFYFDAWVNLYGINVDENTKNLAKQEAISIFNERFTEQKCPSDPDLRLVVNQITSYACP
jgi:hypothetical protein